MLKSLFKSLDIEISLLFLLIFNLTESSFGKLFIISLGSPNTILSNLYMNNNINYVNYLKNLLCYHCNHT